MKLTYRPLFVTLAKHGWTATKLSEESGVSAVTLSRLKRGKATINVETLMRIAKTLKCGLEDICEEIEEAGQRWLLTA